MQWGPDRVRLTLGPTDDAQLSSSRVKSAHAVVFSGSDVLLVREERATWHFPGGRLEHGETVAAALAREMQEEAGAILAPSPRPFAVIRVEFPDRAGARAQEDSFTAYFVAELADLTPEFVTEMGTPEQQIIERCLSPIAKAPDMLSPSGRSLLQEALLGRRPGLEIPPGDLT